MNTYKVTHIIWNIPASDQHYLAALTESVKSALWEVVFPDRDLTPLIEEKTGVEVSEVYYIEVPTKLK